MELLQILLMEFLGSCSWLWKQQACCDHLDGPVPLSGKKSVSVTSTVGRLPSLDHQPICAFVIWILFLSYVLQIFFSKLIFLFYGFVYGAFLVLSKTKIRMQSYTYICLFLYDFWISPYFGTSSPSTSLYKYSPTFSSNMLIIFFSIYKSLSALWLVDLALKKKFQTNRYVSIIY